MLGSGALLHPLAVWNLCCDPLRLNMQRFQQQLRTLRLYQPTNQPTYLLLFDDNDDHHLSLCLSYRSSEREKEKRPLWPEVETDAVQFPVQPTLHSTYINCMSDSKVVG